MPGGPWKRIPFGTRAPSASKRCGSRRKSTISCSSSFASSRPGDVVPGDRRRRARGDLRRLDARHQLDRLPEQVDDHAHQEEEEDRQPRQREVRHELRLKPRGESSSQFDRQLTGPTSSSGDRARRGRRSARRRPARRPCRPPCAPRRARGRPPRRRRPAARARAGRGSRRRRRRPWRRRRARSRPGRAARAARSAFGFVKTSKLFFRSRNSRPAQPAGRAPSVERRAAPGRPAPSRRPSRRRACRAGSAAGRSVA